MVETVIFDTFDLCTVNPEIHEEIGCVRLLAPAEGSGKGVKKRCISGKTAQNARVFP